MRNHGRDLPDADADRHALTLSGPVSCLLAGEETRRCSRPPSACDAVIGERDPVTER